MPDIQLKRIHISADSELAKAMKDARSGAKRVLIDTGEDEYAVYVETDPGAVPTSPRLGASDEEKRALWEGYDPRAALATFDEGEGSWSDIDTDELVANIYRWREEGSRPANRP
ncbi:MAG: hypothetical protein M1118_11345 [Chloroflexi bacterium]|nr:hypothetical protein [Chloroflexota bacterium]